MIKTWWKEGKMSEKTFEQRIAECIADEVNKQFNSGMVEKLIAEKLENGIAKALEDSLGYCGAGKKAIDEKIKEVMVPAIEKHDFNEYLIKIDTVLTEIVNNTCLADNKKIMDNFKELLKEPNVKEIEVSKLFEAYCKHVKENVSTSNLEALHEDGEPYYEHVTARMEVEYIQGYLKRSTYDDCYLKFSCDEDDDLDVQIKLYKQTDKDTWTILKALGDIEINSLRNLSKFEILLSRLDRSYTKIIIDSEELEDDDIEPEEKPEWDLR